MRANPFAVILPLHDGCISQAAAVKGCYNEEPLLRLQVEEHGLAACHILLTASSSPCPAQAAA